MKAGEFNEIEILAIYRRYFFFFFSNFNSIFFREDIFLLWPVTVVHKIDIDSPFYNMSPEDIHSTKFEVVTTLVCTTDTTGRLTEARCSYTPNEILWGHRFRNIITR